MDQAMKEDGEQSSLMPNIPQPTGREKGDEKNKPLDRRQFLQFYTPFASDDNDIDTLQEALEFIKSQVQSARDELVDQERKVSH